MKVAEFVFGPPFPRMIHIKLPLIGQAVSKIFENGRRQFDGYTISSPCEPEPNGELKMVVL